MAIDVLQQNSRIRDAGRGHRRFLGERYFVERNSKSKTKGILHFLRHFYRIRPLNVERKHPGRDHNRLLGARLFRTVHRSHPLPQRHLMEELRAESSSVKLGRNLPSPIS